MTVLYEGSDNYTLQYSDKMVYISKEFIDAIQSFDFESMGAIDKEDLQEQVYRLEGQVYDLEEKMSYMVEVP